MTWVPHTVALMLVLWVPRAHAELGELRAGGNAMAVFPALAPSESTQLASVGFGARAQASLGVLHHRVHVLGRLGVWQHSGDLGGYRHYDSQGRALAGSLRYHGEGYRGEVGLAWQVLGGYSLAPYVRALVGYQWATFREQTLVPFGNDDATIGDTGESSFTAALGVSVEQRLFNSVALGVSADYTRAFGELYSYDLSAAFFTSYYWF